MVNVLTETEIDKMGKLWWKQKSTPFRMTVVEVTTLLEMFDRSTAWRESMKGEKARIRRKSFGRKLLKLQERGIRKQERDSNLLRNTTKLCQHVTENQSKRGRLKRQVNLIKY